MPVPSVRPGTVKVRVAWAGICGSDVHEFIAGPILISSGKPHPLTGQKAPLVLGHEFGGYIVEVGEGVESLLIGQKVAVSPLLYCGRCHYCKTGRYNLCSRMAYMGFNADGGMAGQIVVPAENVFKLPQNVDDEVLALGEPVAVAVHAIRKARLKPRMKVAVVGGGTIGLLVAQIAKLYGASRVFLIEKSIEKRTLIKNMGLPIDMILDPINDGGVNYLREITGGGVDIAFDAGGSRFDFTMAETEGEFMHSLNVALSSVRKDGVVILIAIHFSKHLFMDLIDMLRSEKRIAASWTYTPSDFKEGLKLIAQKKLELLPLITGKINIDDVVDKGLLELELNGDRHIKILVRPNDEAGRRI